MLSIKYARPRRACKSPQDREEEALCSNSERSMRSRRAESVADGSMLKECRQQSQGGAGNKRAAAEAPRRAHQARNELQAQAYASYILETCLLRSAASHAFTPHTVLHRPAAGEYSRLDGGPPAAAGAAPRLL